MSNYGRGYNSGYGGQDKSSQDTHDDEVAKRDGDWDWLSRSPRQQRLRREQGLGPDEFAED